MTFTFGRPFIASLFKGDTITIRHRWDQGELMQPDGLELSGVTWGAEMKSMFVALEAVTVTHDDFALVASLRFDQYREDLIDFLNYRASLQKRYARG